MCRPARKCHTEPTRASAPGIARPRFSRAIVTTLVLALLAAGGGFWWKCTHSETIAFLPTRAGAEWIVFPSQAEGGTHDAISVTAQFRHTFTLTAAPANASLVVCAFRGAAVAINGREIGSILKPGGNWKLLSHAEVAGLLRPGLNEITAWVTNSIGPPALWLRLRDGRFSLGTSERWQVSITGTEWLSARRARQPNELQLENSLRGNPRPVVALRQTWPAEAGFCAASLALVWVMNFWLRRKLPPATTLPARTSTKLIYGLLVIVLIARAALFINNLPQLPRSIGFDVAEHERYIRFIQEKHALPLANEGWQMYQPPLYYMASALALAGCGLSVADEHAVYWLRALNGVIGLLHCWVALLCLRLLFRESLAAQAAGLLVVAFLPPTLYLSQYVTNEPLAAFLVTTAIYFCLRMLQEEKAGLWKPICIGVALGAAMLTKFSVLLALPCILLVLSQQSVSQKEDAHRDWLRSVWVVVAECALVCGWHYGRVWLRFGTPIVGNWDSQAGRAWWQEPGFRTSAFYSSFGRVLISPLYSAFHSFADGIYSTLWGDGLASGEVQPPWNHDLMLAGYWVSLGMSMLVILGVAITFVKLAYQIRGEWLLVFGMVCIYSLGLLWMNLRVPSYAQAKAFYGLPALLPFGAVAAAGWDWLRRRHRVVGTAVWVLLLVWCMTVYAAFWIRRGNPATHLLRGNYLARHGHYSEAVQSFSIAIQLEPGYAEAHNSLGTALGREGQVDEAIRQYQEALRLKPDYAEAHYGLGVLLAKKGQFDQASEQFREALLLKPDYAEARSNLGSALAMKGQIDDAITQYKEAIRLKPDFADAHFNLGNVLCRKGQIDQAIRHYQEALRLNPDNAEAHINLGVALTAQGKLNDAIDHYKKALQLNPDSVQAHYNLGHTLATQGKLNEAIPHFQQALNLATAHNNTALAEAIRTRLKSCQSALPR